LLSRNAGIRGEDPAACAKLLREMYESGVINGSTLEVVSAVDAAGYVYCSSRTITEPVGTADRPYIRQALQTGRFTLGEVVVGRVSGTPTLPAAYPVPNGAGEFGTVLVGGLNLQELAATVPDL